MFDLRNKIKISVRNGEVRYGPRVDEGFFPIFSVGSSEDAVYIIKATPWLQSDSLTTYARKLESTLKIGSVGEQAAQEKPLPNSYAALQPRAEQKANPIVMAIMSANKE